MSTQHGGTDAARKINNNITDCGKKGDWMKILEIHQRDGGDFNAINYSTAMNQLAKSKNVRRQHPQMESFMEGVTRHLHDQPMEWTVRSKVTVLHSIAKMGLDFPAAREAMHLILQDAVMIVEDRSPISVSLTAWSVATMNVDCPELFAAIDRHASHLVKHGNSQTMANTVWACAKLQTPCPAFFRAVDEQAERLVQDGHVQAISITIWAFATLRFDCPRLVRAVGERADDMVEDGSSQNIANTAWAFATMGIESPRLFHAIDQHPACVISNGADAQAIANTAWAFATLNLEGYNFFRAVDDECASCLVQQGTVQHLAMTLWAFASLRTRALSICGQTEEHAVSIVSRGNPQNISNIIWSFATLGVACPTLCHAIDEDANRLIQNGNSQSVANTLSAMSMLGVDAPRLFEAIRNPSVENHFERCNDQELVNICYAFAISESFPKHTDTFTKLWTKAIEIDLDRLPNQGRVQLLQTYLIASYTHGLTLSPPKWSSSPLLVDVNGSQAQEEMSEILEVMGFDHEKEVSPFLSTNQGALEFWHIDCACRERRIAIEFDGPSHYLRLAGSRRVADIENGPTKAKRRFLKSLGWTVLNVSYFEWADAATREGKQALLKTRLESIDVD